MTPTTPAQAYIPAQEKLSISRAYTFGKCRKQYDYKYVQGLKRAPRDMHFDSWLRMFRGNLIHSGMEAGFLQSSIEEQVRARIKEERERGLSKEQEDAIQQLALDCISIAGDALAWLPVTEWEPVMYNGAPMVEAELTAELPGWKSYLGYADLVAKHLPTGSTMLIDYKTRMRFEGEGSDLYNMQFATYMHCLAEMGVHVDGTYLFEIKSVPAKRASRTTYTDPNSVNCVRTSADGRFRGTPTFRSKSFVANFWEDFARQAKVIADLRDEQVYRAMGSFTCGDCPYTNLCMGELAGDDVDFIRTNSFVPLQIILT